MEFDFDYDAEDLKNIHINPTILNFERVIHFSEIACLDKISNILKLDFFSFPGNKILLFNFSGLLFVFMILLTAHNHIITSIQVLEH